MFHLARKGEMTAHQIEIADLSFLFFFFRRNTNDSTVKPNHSANQESTDDIVVDITTKPVKQEKRSEKEKKVKRMYI